MWLWEGQRSERQVTVLDLETSKPRQNLMLEGDKVTCMARVGADVWVGGEVGDSFLIYTVKSLNIRTPKKFVVITLKFELCGSTIE